MNALFQVAMAGRAPGLNLIAEEEMWKQVTGAMDACGGPLHPQFVDFIRRNVREAVQALNVNYMETMHAAILVFMHAMVDTISKDLIALTQRAEKSPWREEASKYELKLNLSDAVSEAGRQRAEKILEDRMELLVKEWNHKPLLSRVQRLFDLCKPQRELIDTANFRYDQERLRRLDETRNVIVHEPHRGHYFEGFDDDMRFLIGVGYMLVLMVRKRYHLEPDPDATMHAVAEHRSWPPIEFPLDNNL